MGKPQLLGDSSVGLKAGMFRNSALVWNDAIAQSDVTYIYPIITSHAFDCRNNTVTLLTKQSVQGTFKERRFNGQKLD